MKAREQALFAALDDMESWLATGADSCSRLQLYLEAADTVQMPACTLACLNVTLKALIA